MTEATRRRVLFATRPINQREPEGGLQLQRDLVDQISREGSLSPAVFATKFSATHDSETMVPIYSDDHWNRQRRLEFLAGTWKHHSNFDILHSAHVPTVANSLALTAIARRHRAAGNASVQTITALPQRERVTTAFLWGDTVVCQSKTALDRVLDAGANATLITPWPNPKRISYDEVRRQATRLERFANWDDIVLFPGEFDRLGVDRGFDQTIGRLLKRRPGTLVILACRFDTEGIGRWLEDRYPGKVLSLGLLRGGMTELLEAADLVIFPARRMTGKFQPPLVLLESLALGTPVYATEVVEMPEDSRMLVQLAPVSLPWVEHGDLIADVLDRAADRVPVSWGFPVSFRQYMKLFSELEP